MNLERKTVHISDDTGRIAMYEYRTVGSDPAPQELMRYIYSNNLSSAMLELDDNGNIISYEEYHPFGTTAYQATNASINAVAKRYRYTGKERDEESGLYYHGARYYIPWLCRWTQCDPIGIKDGLNVYAYVSNNPVMLSDPKGTQAQGREEKPESGKEVKDTTLAPVESSSQTYNLSYSDGTNSVGIKTMVKDNTAVYSINMNIDFSQAGCVAEKLDPLIEEYRKIDPIKAGQLQGAIDFMFDIIEGIANFVENPIEGTIGLIKLGVIIATPPSAFAAEKAELLGAAGQAISSSTDKFIEGDAFIKSRMATYGALTAASFAVGAGEAKAASVAGETSNMIKLGEISQAERVVGAIAEGHLPPLNKGISIGKSRMSEEAMRGLSTEFEFAQVYYPGTGKGGGGGEYLLFRGTMDRLEFPQGGFLINHTHPQGTAMPSIFDNKAIIELEKVMGQKSSVILPANKPSFRFNRNTPFTQ